MSVIQILFNINNQMKFLFLSKEEEVRKIKWHELSV
jgi:hypothetical protein